MTDQEKADKLNQLIYELSQDVAPEVQRIEASIETTQNHYGDYGALISQVSGGKPAVAKIIAAALIKAGANQAGVTNGLNTLVLGDIEATLL
jgi:hypothetical protein